MDPAVGEKRKPEEELGGQESKQKQDKPALYTYFRSSCAYRVRIALALKQVDYEKRFVHLVKGEHTTEEYSKLNPMKSVPVFITSEGKPIAQSMAILEYIEEAYPQAPILPKDVYQRARVRQLANIINSDIAPVQNLRVLKQVQAVTGKEEAKGEWAKHWIAHGLKALEAEVAHTAGKYCVGDEVTLADLCLVPQIYNAKRWGVDMSAFPTLVKINDNLQQLDAFVVAAPEAQPDCDVAAAPKPQEAK